MSLLKEMNYLATNGPLVIQGMNEQRKIMLPSRLCKRK